MGDNGFDDVTTPNDIIVSRLVGTDQGSAEPLAGTIQLQSPDIGRCASDAVVPTLSSCHEDLLRVPLFLATDAVLCLTSIFAAQRQRLGLTSAKLAPPSGISTFALRQVLRGGGTSVTWPDAFLILIWGGLGAASDAQGRRQDGDVARPSEPDTD